MDQVAELLEKLAERLGTTVEHLWGVLINQAPIHGIGYLALYGALLLTTFISVLYMKKIYRGIAKIKKREKEAKTTGGSDEDYLGTVLSIIGAVLLYGGLIAGTIIALCHISLVLAAFLNPEYWALKHIIDFVK